MRRVRREESGPRYHPVKIRVTPALRALRYVYRSAVTDISISPTRNTVISVGRTRYKLVEVVNFALLCLGPLPRHVPIAERRVFMVCDDETLGDRRSCWRASSKGVVTWCSRWANDGT